MEARLNGEESLESSGLFEIEWSHNICQNGDIGKEFEAQLDDMRRENEDRARAEEDQVSNLLLFKYYSVCAKKLNYCILCIKKNFPIEMVHSF